MTELEPCPICGGKARMLGGLQAQETLVISCTECRCSMVGGFNEEKLAAEWNTRKTKEEL